LVEGAKGSGYLLTLVERKTGYLEIGKLPNKTKQATKNRAIKLIGRQSLEVKTITSDHGTEFHCWEAVEKRTRALFYFATPYHSWERGTNENTNGLIRQYLPKRKSMKELTQWDCNRIARKLNTRPRKRLEYNTPEECYVQN